MSGDNTALNTFLLIIVAALLLLVCVVYSSSFSDMVFTRHALEAHAGEDWDSRTIAWWLDCHPNDVQHTPTSDGGEKAWCQLNANKAIGLVVKAGVIITGFMGAVWYWRRKE